MTRSPRTVILAVMLAMALAWVDDSCATDWTVAKYGAADFKSIKACVEDDSVVTGDVCVVTPLGNYTEEINLTDASNPKQVIVRSAWAFKKWSMRRLPNSTPINPMIRVANGNSLYLSDGWISGRDTNNDITENDAIASILLDGTLVCDNCLIEDFHLDEEWGPNPGGNLIYSLSARRVEFSRTTFSWLYVTGPGRVALFYLGIGRDGGSGGVLQFTNTVMHRCYLISDTYNVVELIWINLKGTHSTANIVGSQFQEINIYQDTAPYTFSILGTNDDDVNVQNSSFAYNGDGRGYKEFHLGGSLHCTAWNNIFWGPQNYGTYIPIDKLSSVTLTSQNNDMADVTPSGTNFSVDPQWDWNNNLRLYLLEASSPCIDAGMDLSGGPGWILDILGNLFGGDGDWDVGAHEFGGAKPCASIPLYSNPSHNPAGALLFALLPFVVPLVWIGLLKRGARSRGR